MDIPWQTCGGQRAAPKSWSHSVGYGYQAQIVTLPAELSHQPGKELEICLSALSSISYCFLDN